MKRLGALLLAACLAPVVAAAPPDPRVAAVDAVARRYALAGEVLVAKGDAVLLDRGYGTIAPAGGAPHRAGERWRLASITKQVTAALVVRQLAQRDRTLAILDAPIKPREPHLAGVTPRQLLTHHSGLANPNDLPAEAGGFPDFYRTANPDLSYCVSRPAVPGAPFSYNNCDYLMLGTVFPKAAWPHGMTMARAGDRSVTGYVGGKPEAAFELASYGAAGGLIGNARDVFGFDRDLMTGKLMPANVRDALWTPEGNGSYQALGQWVFPGKLAGCAAPKRIVQRDGEIGGVQARNFILPDDDLVVIMFTNRSSDDFPLGEVWEGKGFVYDLLSAAACP